MFDNLTNKIESAFAYFNKITRLDEKQADEGLRKIRQALLESDVALSVTKKFIENVKPKIFWKDKPSFLKQIKKWNSKKLNEAKKILVETEIQMKTKFNNYNSVLIKNLVLRIYQIANSTS